MLKSFKYGLVSVLFGFLVACSPNSSSTNNVDENTALSKQALINRIANNLKSLAPINLGSIQLMQYEKNIENMNYSYEELQNLDRMTAERVKSEKIYLEYSERMYNSLLQALQDQQLKFKN